MSEKKGPSSSWRSFKTVINLALIALAIVLAITAYSRLSDTARAILLGAFCTLGVIVTVIMLVVLVRQSSGKD
jgi:uncharacterized membrane protein YidH (DUF202 family)